MPVKCYPNLFLLIFLKHLFQHDYVKSCLKNIRQLFANETLICISLKLYNFCK